MGVLSPDKRLAFTYARARDRQAVRALFAVDAVMGDVVSTTTEPPLGLIRLAWWRERLEELDAGMAAAEPRLQAVEDCLLPRGVTGKDCAALEGGWVRLFDPFPWDRQTAEAIWFRGNLLFGLGARIFGEPNEQIQSAGGLWALVDAARHCSDAESRVMLVGQARTFARALGGRRFASALRPLSMLAAVSFRDCRGAEPFEAEGTPGRAVAMLHHRLSGRLPRL